MAAYFQLTRKGETEPVVLTKVDAELCAANGVEPDKVHWYRNWYNTIGFCLAIGRSWEEAKELFPGQADIADWLRERYDVEAWYGR